MDPVFWATRWQEGKTAFHEGAPNAYLVAHHGWLADCRRVLVPLCGKSEDLAFLASKGHEVIGIELVEDAVKQFFDAHAIAPKRETDGALVIYRADSITLIVGDVFTVTPAHVGAIDGIFDRAALVALPPEMRERYVAQLRTLAPAARREVLVSIEYPEGAHPGPPFCVGEPEVRKHFADAAITEVGYGPDPQGRLDGQMRERCYTLAWSR